MADHQKTKTPKATKAPPAPKPEGYTFGRPTKYLPQYCDDVIRMGSEGYSVVEMCAEIGVARNTFEVEWPQVHPDFSQALAAARLNSQAWWEGQGRKGLSAERFQAALYSRSMAARFPADWRESKHQEVTGSVKFDHTQTASNILETLAAAKAKAEDAS